ncbi:MAG TPA: trypsin-like peptidase domain-containing protein [Jatrophihabitans sp.]|nr:trypsin-like peptidase domain-containing protein [Jatrophihabitans sp.]
MAEPVQTQPPNRSNRIVIITVAAVVLVVVGFIVWGVAGSKNATSEQTNASTTAVCPAVSVANNVLPSVVTLAVQGASGNGTGSGEVIRDGGYILTNDHVISAGANGGTIEVLFSSGKTERAQLVGRSIELDLAVLRVPDSDYLKVIGIGRSNNLLVGEPVVALGAPLGLNGTVTAGIVSALGRQVPLPAAEGRTAILPGAIQTDAAINPGNSGGALVNCDGKLIGINTAIATVPNEAGQSGGGSVGIGFAIPVDLAMTVTDQLIETGKFTPPSVGLTTLPISQEVASQVGLSGGGLYVQSVQAGGPGAAAGLQPGDIIVKVDGDAVAHPISLFASVVNKKPGDKVSVEYVRDGTTKSTTLTLG